MESGLDRILSYSTSFFPALWKAVSSSYDKNGKLLLAHLLDVLVGWMENSREAVALSGVYLCQDLVEGVAKDLDEDGWRVVLENLRFAWTVCVEGKKTTPSSSQESNSESTGHQPFKSWAGKSDHSLTLSLIQTRCQVLISLQRVMHKIHQKHGHLLLLEMHSELTELLLDVVQQVTEANKDPEFIQAIRTCLLESDHSSGLDFSQKATSFQKSEVKAMEEEVQEAPDKTLVRLPSVKVDPSQSSPTHASASPQMEELPELKTSVLGTHSSFHGLLKLQLEGGMLTIEALRR